MIAKQKVKCINTEPEIEFASKHNKYLSQSPYSPLLVGLVEEDTLSEADFPPQTSLLLAEVVPKSEADNVNLVSTSQKHSDRAL